MMWKLENWWKKVDWKFVEFRKNGVNWHSGSEKISMSRHFFSALEFVEFLTCSFQQIIIATLIAPFRSTSNTGCITCLGMCKVCSEAVHSIALKTRVTLHVWACVKCVPKQSIPLHLKHGLHYMCGHASNMGSQKRAFYSYGFQAVGINFIFKNPCMFQ